MSKPRWTIEQKGSTLLRRASGLTRQQYCELNDIPFYITSRMAAGCRKS